jgi:hypothetical protein
MEVLGGMYEVEEETFERVVVEGLEDRRRELGYRVNAAGRRGVGLEGEADREDVDRAECIEEFREDWNSMAEEGADVGWIWTICGRTNVNEITLAVTSCDFLLEALDDCALSSATNSPSSVGSKSRSDSLQSSEREPSSSLDRYNS